MGIKPKEMGDIKYIGCENYVKCENHVKHIPSCIKNSYSTEVNVQISAKKEAFKISKVSHKPFKEYLKEYQANIKNQRGSKHSFHNIPSTNLSCQQ